MNKTLSLCGVLLAAMVSVASAAPGVAIRWDKCFGEGTGTRNRNFACDTNTGTNKSVSSFVLASDIVDVSGNEIVIDLAAASSTVPAWWQFKNSGTWST